MPRSFVHLGLEERRRIHRLREAKVPVARIATALGRHRSTIHREIARNGWRDAEVPQAEGYWPLTAQELAVRRRCVRAKLERHPERREAVVDRLRAGWSPEQIAGPGSGSNPPPRTGCATRRSTASSTAPEDKARSWPDTCPSAAGAADLA